MREGSHVREICFYAVVLFGSTWLLMRMDAYESLHEWSRAHEHWELDELALTLFGILICLALFAFNRVRDLKKGAALLEDSRRDLAKAHEELRVLHQSRETFLTTACHELKSPLVGIVNALELMQLSGDDDERSELIELTWMAARKLGVLVDGVLEFSRQESLSLSRGVFSPAELIESVRDMSRLQARSEGLSVSAQVAEGTPALVYGSESVLRLVALNLVGNAVRYTERSGVRIELGYDHESGGELVLTVSDTGRGIPVDELETIFEPYETGSGGGNGFGLGLSIVKRSVERIQGTVSVDSTPGKGSRFTVRLPAAEAEHP
ncbi:HAMP domain-containing sensor histidine kinase [Pseudodesulfovibrio thermohalotolerans]|uniref:sensor histidine kinase n=1 Tax=Pseudodesulfovibrio thermohalotolerans TaxID=2880651 RepID=UPI0024425959|nr:HAMP domain-containing sensor histidine kinase [Pseudodesulfovibrio thermohalotolerans]WFS62622.1 HAMP domain-containing sensor histidine kinase [Pseudodesulfovibrio thermohalotolerans]